MGCRTQTSAQQNRGPQLTVEGNVVRKDAVQLRQKNRIRPHGRNVSAAGSRALRRQKAFFVTLGIIGAVILVSLCGTMLWTMDASTQLADEVLEKEKELEQIMVANDAREYEIGNSVDLNDIIEVATQELGMVRSNLSQVVTFRTKDTEYLQQVAQVPTE